MRSRPLQQRTRSCMQAGLVMKKKRRSRRREQRQTAVMVTSSSSSREAAASVHGWVNLPTWRAAQRKKRRAAMTRCVGR